MGLGWSIVRLQHRINPQIRQCHLQEVAIMRLVGRERCALYVLDEIIAVRGELTGNVRTVGSLVADNEAVAHHELAISIDGTVPDATSTMRGSIAVNGAKDDRCLGIVTSISDPTTGSRGFIGRDRAVDEGERAPIIEDAPSTRGYRCIGPDRAPDEREHPIIVDAPSLVCDVAGDGRVAQRERPIIVDATTISRVVIYRPMARDDAVA